MNEKTTDTPLMRQYKRAKAECPPGTILLFRIGDFYEMFNSDAHVAAGILDLSLTRRAGADMCGVPYHCADRAIEKILAAGRPVAICDQLETPGSLRGAVARREVTGIFKPEQARGACEKT